MACALATVLFLFFFGVLCVMAWQERGSHQDSLGFAVALFIMGLLAFFTSFLAWRLWRGNLSTNGVTTMPSWFIQLFGSFLLVGVIFVGFTGGGIISLIEGISIALAMILVSRNIARRKKPGA
ncbi:MAG: hypothetical protein P4N60_17125 [Verrucomicrobiae bacterium]|nr:hypothetical protein [Verrucomicrobiae bacterium]